MKTHEVKRQGDRGQRTKSPLTGEESGLKHYVKGERASAGKGGFRRMVRIEPTGSEARAASIGKDRPSGQESGRAEAA